MPGVIVSPGDRVLLELETHHLHMADLAHQVNWPLSVLSRVLMGREPVTEGMAEDLEQIFGVDTGTWARLQASWDEGEGQ